MTLKANTHLPKDESNNSIPPIHPVGPRGNARIVLLTGAAVVIAICVTLGTFLATKASNESMSNQSAPSMNQPALAMKGVLLVVGGGTPPIMDNKGPCGNGGGFAPVKYEDLVAAALTVYDDAGKIVGTGTLGTGVSTPDPHGTPMGDCTTHFTIENLPDRPFYSLEVANRGRVTVNRVDLSNVMVQLGG